MNSPYKPQAGRFLVSEPFMDDPNFSRTVVLLAEHNEKGSLGFVLNRQLNASINNIIEDLPAFKAPVFLGGPVEQNTLHFVHRLGDLVRGSRLIAEGLYWSGDFDDVRELIANGKIATRDILFFVGYSGWGEGQLEQELTQKAWIVAPSNAEFVFTKNYQDLWRKILRHMGEAHSERYKVISNYPVDPRLN